MDAKAMRDMGLDELQQKRAEFKDEIFHLTLRRATGQLESPMKLRQSRRDLARLETIIGELRRAAERKAAERKAAEQKAAEQKAAEQKDGHE